YIAPTGAWPSTKVSPVSTRRNTLCGCPSPACSHQKKVTRRPIMAAASKAVNSQVASSRTTGETWGSSAIFARHRGGSRVLSRRNGCTFRQCPSSDLAHLRQSRTRIPIRVRSSWRLSDRPSLACRYANDGGRLMPLRGFGMLALVNVSADQHVDRWVRLPAPRACGRECPRLAARALAGRSVRSDGHAEDHRLSG